MNKGLHRVVFNVARGTRMAVQETAASAGKGSSKASGESGDTAPAVVVAALALFISFPGHAQIVGAPGAGVHRPTVLVAPNGVPLVNITTPSAAGVSRNIYSQFDVQRNGVILNNSRTAVQTQLGGMVQGNPWLARGPARVIVNEVNSGRPSSLRGFVEVGGRRAEVIIANPAGISVDGAGFINASRATLTTGTPQYNAAGGLDSFVVREGSVSVEGLGLDAGTTDYAAILARAVQVNAGIWANELQVIAGANEISADHTQVTPTAGTGPRPAFSLDVALLGGMYAGKIKLIGSEAGLGVRNAGNIGFGVGGLVITAEGLENRGVVEARRLELSSKGDIDNRGGTIRQTGDAELTLTAPVLSNAQGGVIGVEPAAPQASVSPAAHPTASPTGGGTVHVPGTVPGADATATPSQPNTPDAPGSLTAGGTFLNDGGRVYAQGGVALRTPQINNAGGTLSLAHLTVSGAGFSNAGGMLDIRHAFSADVGRFDNTGGTVHAGSMSVRAVGDLVNQDGVLASEGHASLAIGGTFDNLRGGAGARGDLAVQAGALNNAGALRAENDLRLNVSGSLGNDGSITAGRHASVTAKHVSATGLFGAGIRSDGTLGGAGDLSLVATQSLTARGANLAAGKAALQGGSVDLRGSDTIATHIVLTATQDNMSTSAATVAARGTLDIHAVGAIDNRKGTLASHGNMTIASGDLNNTQGAIHADARVAITSTSSVDNSAGLISAREALRIVDPNAARGATKTLALTNTGGTLAADKHLQIDAATWSADGTVNAGKDLSIALTQNLVNHSNLSVGGNLSYSTTGDFTNNAKLTAGQQLNVAGRNVANNATGEMSGADTRVAAVDTLVNRGLIDSAGHTQADAATLDNIGTGRIYGDRVSSQTGTLRNTSETVNGVRSAGTIASRTGDVDIGTQVLDNSDAALLFSGGNMRIGGALDADRRATGRAAVVDNIAASIEATGNLHVGARQLNNLNRGFSTRQSTTVEAKNEQYISFGLGLGGTRYTPGELGLCYQCAADRRDDGRARNRLEYVAPSAAFAFDKGYERKPYQLPGGAFSYAATDPVWVLFGVAVGDNATLGARLGAYNADYMARAAREYSRITVTNTVTTQTEVDNPGVAGRITSGGNMHLDIGTGRNQNSQVIAGGALTGTADSLVNSETLGTRTVVDNGFWQRDHVEYSPYRVKAGRYGSGAYAAPRETRTIDLSTAVKLQHTAPGGAGHAPGGAAVGGSGGGRPGVVFEVAANAGGSAGRAAPMVVRTSAPDSALPAASLFRTRPAPSSPYLIETDPRFTNYRNWLSSDYLLDALGSDPARVQKRLGDGFHEQKLIREQVAKLTGHRYLDGYTSDEEQYLALLNAGATYARQFNLRPGISLSATQMAQLTSDIVWLVEQTVTLPDGSTQQVLAPQLYVRVKPGDLDGTGALLAGQRIDLQLTGDLRNSGGTVAGRQTMVINADNIHNINGRLTGRDVGLQTRNDLNIVGGTVDAVDSLVALAGRDINLRSTTADASSEAGASSFSRTDIDRIAGLYVSGHRGVLAAGAWRDANVIAGVIANAGTGDTVLMAQRDIHLGTVTERRSDNFVASATNYSRPTRSTEVGSVIQGDGNVLLAAGNDLNARAATVDALGDLSATADRDVVIEDGQRTLSTDMAYQSTSKSLLSRSTLIGREREEHSESTASEFGGRTVAIGAGNDVRVTGSHIVSDAGTHLVARNDITIEAGTDTHTGSSERDEKTSGAFASGGIGFTIGGKQQSTDQQNRRSNAAASTVGSIGGDVAIVAGNAYRQIGSDLLAPEGDVSVLAKKIDIVEARETTRSETEEKSRQSGLTLALTAPIVTAMQGIADTAQATRRTGSGRMQALGAASAAMEAKAVAEALAVNPAQAMGVNLAISIGGSQSQRNTVETSDTARGSSVAAGGDLTLMALGGGENSNITVQGSDIRAGRDAALVADNQVNLLAARNDWEQHSTNKGSAASIGVSVGTSGFLVNASASANRGRSDGTDVAYSNTHVKAGNRATVISGGDTTMRGATLEADSVKADIGGQLNIESLQDTSRADSKQQSAGGSLSVGAGVWSASVSMSSARASGDYASVTQQSGIQAGDGGFDVDVKGATTLTGGAIGSTQAAVDQGRNRFETASLNTSDIVNRDSHRAGGTTLGLGASGAAQTSTGGAAGAGKSSGSQASVTRAGISGIAGDEAVRTGTDGANALTKRWDTDSLVSDVQAQAQITQGFGANASRAVGDYAGGKAAALRREGKEEEAKAWDEGGANRALAHALVGGLTGNVQGAGGAALAAVAAPTIDELTAGLPEGVRGAVGAGLAAGLGAGVGGAAGASAGLNEDFNNRQLHQSEYDFAKKNAKVVAKKLGISEQEAEGRIVAEILRNSDETTATGTGGKHDYQVRSIVGCQNLNCSGYKNDPSFKDPNYNSQYLGLNQYGYDAGLNQLPQGRTYNEQVIANVKNNPAGTAIAGASMVALGSMIGGSGTALGIKLLGAGIGAGANYGFQPRGEPTEWVDLGIAGLTGFITTGAGLGSSVITNSGGAILGSSIKGENPNASTGAAVAGTIVGYGAGKGVETPLNTRINPWWRATWFDLGFGISRQNPANPLPGVGGNIFSSGVQEATGNSIKDALQRVQPK